MHHQLPIHQTECKKVESRDALSRKCINTHMLSFIKPSQNQGDDSQYVYVSDPLENDPAYANRSNLVEILSEPIDDMSMYLSSSESNEKKPNSEVSALLTTNPVFLQTIPLPKEQTRERIPKVAGLKNKMNVLSLVKELIGKDLTRVSLPVWLNEPLSTLQRVCERMEYVDLLNTANSQQDSCLRLAYFMAFAFTCCSAAHPSRKKPFNPILGETFELAPNDGSYRLLAEQVSHHPPITAEFTDAVNYQLWSTTNSKVNFKGTHVEVKVRGECHAMLKKFNDQIVHDLPVFTLNNLIIGTRYVDYIGEVPYTNLTTGDTGLMSFKKRGRGSKGAFEGQGWIKDKDGNLRYTLYGQWNSHLTLKDLTTGQETKIWEKTPVPDDFEEQYSLTQFAKMLNYLNEDLACKLPPTDNRLRPDQRALEFGLLDLATSEKRRLEEKQRKRAEELKDQGRVHQPRWFRESEKNLDNVPVFEYIGGYWESREKGNFGQCYDIFGR